MKLHPALTEEVILEAVTRYHQSLDNPGFCIFCGEEADSVEPDARAYKCECCGKPGVYGAEELLLRFCS